MMSDKTILLVEDNPDDEALTLRAFKKQKITNPVVIARDGVMALDYLFGTGAFAGRDSSDTPQVVLLDLKLPKRSGFEVLTWVRAQPGLKRLPVVVLTSSRELEDVDRAYELGANSYLVKPVRFEDLLEMVKTIGMYWMILNKSAAPPPDPAPPDSPAP